ncbi:MAG: hypothetical protein ACUVRD_05120 [Bacteroidia bacterium]
MILLGLIWGQLLWKEEYTGSLIAKGWQAQGIEIGVKVAYHPPTGLYAVLNGADTAGIPYQFLEPRSVGWGDALTSPCVNLSLSPSDTIYLLLACQRGGYMDPPEADDTLAIEVQYDSSWVRVFSLQGTGRADTAFSWVSVPVRMPQGCVRFRFRVWGSLAGAFDNWLIGPCALYAGPPTSVPVGLHWKELYRRWWTPYTAVPFWAVRRLSAAQDLGVGKGSLPSQLVRATLSVGQVPVVKSFFLRGDTLLPWQPNWDTYTDSFRVYVEGRIQGQEIFTLRDSFEIGRFYAYDEGYWHAGYGLSRSFASVVQEFYLDTLVYVTSIDIAFFPTPANRGKAFRLVIYDPMRPDTPLYARFENVRWGTTASLFTRYRIEKAFPWQGRLWVGIQQADDRPIGIGWDYRMPVRVFRDSSGTWIPSRLAGGMLVRLGVAQEDTSAMLIHTTRRGLFPNPTPMGQWAFWEGPPCPFVLYNAQGQQVRKGMLQKGLHAPMQKGLYILLTPYGSYRWLIE